MLILFLIYFGLKFFIILFKQILILLVLIVIYKYIKQNMMFLNLYGIKSIYSCKFMLTLIASIK